MSMAVDYNELKFFILTILMAGEVCFEAKDFNRGFFFFVQAV